MRLPLDERPAVSCNLEAEERRRRGQRDQIDSASRGATESQGQRREFAWIRAGHADIQIARGARVASGLGPEEHRKPHFRLGRQRIRQDVVRGDHGRIIAACPAGQRGGAFVRPLVSVAEHRCGVDAGGLANGPPGSEQR